MGTARVPLYALIATVVFVLSTVLLVIFAPPEHQGVATLLGLLVSTLPSLVAAFSAERASRDIRNGMVEEKARAGAVAALQETGVTDIVEVTQRGQSAIMTMQALARLLERNTAVTLANTEMGNDNGR